MNIHFVWENGRRPSKGGLYAFVRIEERRSDVRTAGPVLRASPPILLSGPATLPALRNVPHGDRRVVIAEIRSTEWSNDRILYFGISEPFSLGRGDRAEITSVLKEAPPESAAGIGPPPPNLDRIVFKRTPWGTDATQGVPLFVIEGTAGSAPPNSTVVVFSKPKVEEALSLGRAPARSDGSFSVPLGGVDLASFTHAYVGVADSEGRLSQAGQGGGLEASLVRNVVWTATLANKVRGRNYPNPHRVETTSIASDALGAPDAVLREPESSDIARLTRVDGDSLAAVGSSTWRPLGTLSPRPSSRGGHAMAYDAARGRVVLYGGFDGATVLQDTWEWDGSNWIQRSPETSPPARRRPGMAYDAARGRVVLFGGNSGPSYLNDTWEWDGSDWTQRFPVDSPPARVNHAIAYDAARGRVVLFGGGYENPLTLLQDTWEWDGSNWTERSSGSSPPARYGHAMAYDATRGRVIMFGGYRFDARQDTWEWDGSNWTQLSPGSSPPARYGHAMAYDAARERVVLFGGADRTAGTDVDLQDTWEWDGSNWIPLSPGSSPPSRFGHAMAYDAARGRVALFGGGSTTGGFLTDIWQDTWEWDGSIWIQRMPTSLPPRRFAASMAYDAAQGRVVLFGGARGLFGGIGQLQDTWEYASDLRPGILASFDWGSAGVSTADVEGVSFSSRVGGRGYTTVVPGTGTAVPGAELHRWDAYAGQWLPAGTPNQADSSDPAALSYSSRSRPEAQRLIDRDGQMHFRFRTATGSGNGPNAEVDLKYLELTVHYVIDSGKNPVCGNGKIELANRELCDDGNTAEGDGCAADCRIEYGWSCFGEPSVCTRCGDGIVEGAEECDDGNLINGVGCNDVCLVEPGWTCMGAPSACTRS